MENLVSVLAFHKVFRETVAVVGVEFALHPGEILGLVGPNGAGKTTTLRTIAGIIRTTQGHVLVVGHDIVKEPVAAKRLLAFVPDDPRLFDALTVWEHLQFIAAAYRVKGFEAKAERLLQEFELTEKRKTPAQEKHRSSACSAASTTRSAASSPWTA